MERFNINILSFQPVVTPKFLQKGFDWGKFKIDWSQLFKFSRSNVEEAADIRAEIQSSVDHDHHAVDLEVSDYKGVEMTRKDLKEIKKEAVIELEEKSDQPDMGFMEKISNLFNKFKH